ncbi:MAG TPA: hypothetical protein VE571_02825, partial [Solirubrobacteraceae bacterium]|nr:hypothetical protein [Solirubrobacteraceae bacterium]
VAFLGACGGMLVIAATAAPQWAGIVTVVTLVIWFYMFAAVVHPVPGPPSSNDPPGGADRRRPVSNAAPCEWGAGAEPSWWPQFERDFADYLALRARKRQRHL